MIGGLLAFGQGLKGFINTIKKPKSNVDDLIQNSKLISPKTKGPQVTYQKSGTYDDALRDFNSLEGLSDVKPITGDFEGFTGTLPGNRTVTVRNGSSGNAPGTKSQPTIQINATAGTGGQKQKIRYDSE